MELTHTCQITIQRVDDLQAEKLAETKHLNTEENVFTPETKSEEEVIHAKYVVGADGTQFD